MLHLRILPAAFAALLLVVAQPGHARAEEGNAKSNTPQSEQFSILFGGKKIGKIVARHDGGSVAISFEYRQNGRGPTIDEKLRLNDAGLPVEWTVSGTTTFGNPAKESLSWKDGLARWTDATGSGEARPDGASLYVSQFASPYAYGVYARALLREKDLTLPALPSGRVRLAEIEQVEVAGPEGKAAITAYALFGLDQDPTYFFLDGEKALFAVAGPRFAIVREGFEAEDERLRAKATQYNEKRFEAIQAKAARRFEGPVRIRNVRVFDPDSLALTDPVSVVVEGKRIKAIEPLSVATGDTETEIDGAGGTLLAGLTDMHAHSGIGDALANLAAGVTVMRDMGNENDVLDELVRKIDAGIIAGPHIVRSGFIEGKSQYRAIGGVTVAGEAEAVQAVRDYAKKGVFQIKIYNSMKPEWVPAIVREAHKHGLRVTGHIPAFSNADAMIRAGYDEITHINQLMLGWVLKPEEDTRTLLRITAQKRFPAIDLDSPEVRKTLKLMVDRGVAHDPTTVIHETALLGRNGEVVVGARDYVDHMPINFQRRARTAWLDIGTAEDDRAYRAAFAKILETLSRMRELGIHLLPGTDMGGAFFLHRELELFEKIGFTRAEVLKRATYDAAVYLSLEKERGSIAPGKLADFFLVPGDPTSDLKAVKTISLVASEGVFYAPADIYPEMGIRPFADPPAMTPPAKKAAAAR